MLRLFRLILPALLPSWAFFREVGPSPRIEVQTPGGWAELTPRPVSLSVRRLVLRLFWNPDWNAALFRVSLAERIAANGETNAAKLLKEEVRRYCGPVPFRTVFIYREEGRFERFVDHHER